MTRGRRVRGFVVGTAIAIGACVSIPKFTAPSDGGTDANGNGDLATLVTYHFRFSDAGAHYPDVMTIEGQDLMGNPGSMCWDEEDTGVIDFPAFRLSNEPDTNTGPPPTFTEVLPIVHDAAPLDIAKVDLTWSQTHVTCDGQREMTGRTVYTMFPDGRVNRYDHVEQTAGSNGPLGPSDACNCEVGSETQWRVFGYSTFAGITDIRLPNKNAFTPDSTRAGSSPGPVVCATHATGRKVAFGWPSARTRIRTANGATAFMLDFIDPAATQEAIAPVSTRTDMLLASTTATCDALVAHAQALGANPPLAITVGGSTLPIFQSQIDGIYGGEPATGPVGFLVDGAAPLELAGAMGLPSGWAIWLRFSGGHPDHYVASGPIAQSEFHMQLLGDGTMILWFQRGLAPNATLRLTPMN